MIEQELKPLDQSLSKRILRILPSIVLIGGLSMLFAEIFSGSSKGAWYMTGGGILITFPLYAGHVLFLVWIALKLKKTSLSQLYVFGIIFGLYESWITKVLWAGYNLGHAGINTFLGLGVSEFPILVFFWHPVMSFILPILVFEILTGKIITGHDSLLKKSTKKTILITLFSILVGTFIAVGNQFSLVSVNLALIGTLLLILGSYYFARKSNLKVFAFGKTGFTIVSMYLLLLYVGGFFLLLPERIPKGITPYISIIIFYVIAILLISKSKQTEAEFTSLHEGQYSVRDIVSLAAVVILSVNVACIMPPVVSLVLLSISYLSLACIGVILFVTVAYKTVR